MAPIINVEKYCKNFDLSKISLYQIFLLAIAAANFINILSIFLIVNFSHCQFITIIISLIKDLHHTSSDVLILW